ncbi:hypothetical protein B296_00021367 [Ensete ventricosum]|uniref:Uncharacterized protein n=1 Tax=Ensete ventricosum TaxID=4639 RepID=A0A426YYL9_ENSVE|nr:hypothetical protein B296_00021367 [Ensete ventricosum]
MRAAVEGIREIGRLKDWWTEGFSFWVRFVAVLGAIWGCGFVEFRLRIGDFVLVMKMAFMLIMVRLFPLLQLRINDQRFEDAEEVESASRNGHQFSG